MTTRIEFTDSRVFAKAPVILVLLEENDAPLLIPWINDYAVTRTLGRDGPITMEKEKEWLLSCCKNTDVDITVGIWVRDAQKLIGGTGLHGIDMKNQHDVFGISIGDATQWNKGYGTHVLMQILYTAFVRRNMRSVTLNVFSNNLRAVACYTKCGFIEVGRFTEHMYRDGVWCDTILMQVKRDSWQQIFSKFKREKLV